MHKILLAILSMLILIVGALLVIPSFIDWSQYKDQIKTQVANATGYQLDLNGELRAAFLPYPHVILNNIAINSNGVQGPVAFQGQVEKISVSLALLPLLSGDIAVSDITLIKPDISVQEQKYTATEDKPTDTDANGVQTSESQSAAPAIQIDRFYLEDAKISYKALGGDPMVVQFPSLELKADSLYGPYDYEGRVIYNDFNIGFDGKVGEYSKTAPIQISVILDGDAYQFGYSGIADMTKDVPSFQGEVNVTANSIKDLAAKFVSKDLPVKDQSFALKGLLSGSSKAATLDNGEFSFGASKGNVQFKASNMDQARKSITAALAFSNALNLDNILVVSSKSTSTAPTATDAGKGADATYRFIPETIELPTGMDVTFNLSAPEIIYQGQVVTQGVVTATLTNGQLKGSVKAASIPGGGTIAMNMGLVAESTSRNGAGGAIILANPAFSVNGELSVNSLKAVAADWLKLTEVKTFDNPQIPQSMTGQIQAKIQGATARLTSSGLTLGQYNIKGLNLAYHNAAAPTLDLAIADFAGAKISAVGTLDQSQGVKVGISHPNAAQFIRVFKPDFEATPNMQQSFAFDGTILKDGDVISVPTLTAKIGDISTTGALSANMSGDVPSVEANLAFGNLDTQALLTGEKSTAAKSNGGASQPTAAKSTAAPWTRDAIDTSFLRSINLDLQAKAQQLIHGTWVISNPVIDLDLKNGVLDINDISGGLFDGSLKMNARVSAEKEGQPMSIKANIDTKNVNLNRLVKAALSQTKDRVSGTGSFNIDLSTSGLSSSALIYALNGDGEIQTSEMIVYGIDLAKVTEAISDESLKDLGVVVQGAFTNGQTLFKPIDYPLTIREGTMPVDNFTLESSTAKLISKGEVSFARWVMDLKNTIDFTDPDDLPSVDMTIKGPLNAPQQNVASDVLKSFILNKYGAKIQNKVQKILGDKLGTDNPANELINNLLGLPQPTIKAAPTPAETTQDSAAEPTSTTTDVAPAPAANDNQVQQSPEEQLMRGLLNQLGK